MECASSRPSRVTVEPLDIAVDSRYKPLSQRLSEVLEVVGASNNMRRRLRRKSVYAEATGTALVLPSYDIYIFGSSYEGSTTTGMVADIDQVQIYNDIGIVRNPSEVQVPSGDCLLLIQDDSTPHGYCKLQLVHNGIPMRKGDKGWKNKEPALTIRSDKRNKLVCCFHEPYKRDFYERHGPAVRMGRIDTVFALRCFTLPDCAAEWFKRERKYNWPSPHLIKKCSTLGFLLVAVGHPNSSEKELQWRLSFSFQERLLVEQFNSVQFKCYIALKYIKMEMQDKYNKKLFLSSYHLKTAMFYLIENTPSDFWKPENLVSCVIAALKMFRGWIENDNCPNYFIPDENMFEGKTDDKTRYILSNAIQEIISNSFEQFIYQIQRDCLCYLITSSPQSHIFQNRKTDGNVRSLALLNDGVLNVLAIRNRSIRKYYNRNTEEFISMLTLLEYLVRYIVTQEQDKEKQTAWSYCLPFIQVSRLSNRVAFDISGKKSKEEIWKSLTCDSWRALHLKLDSSKLKQASLMYMLEYNQQSLDNLASLQHESRSSVCRCRIDKEPFNARDPLTAGVRPDLTPEEFLRDIVSPCVVFLPYESNVTHIAMRYEMIRSFGMPPESSPAKNLGNWYEWGVVDGRFLRHFLLYLNYRKLGLHYLTYTSILDMINLLKEKVSHRETCFNLLGWVFNLYGLINWAYLWLKLSILVQPTHNAALWHMCFLILDLQADKAKEYRGNKADSCYIQ